MKKSFYFFKFSYKIAQRTKNKTKEEFPIESKYFGIRKYANKIVSIMNNCDFVFKKNRVKFRGRHRKRSFDFLTVTNETMQILCNSFWMSQSTGEKNFRLFIIAKLWLYKWYIDWKKSMSKITKPIDSHLVKKTVAHIMRINTDDIYLYHLILLRNKSIAMFL